MIVSDYPFTQEAAERVRALGYTLESLLDKTSFKSVRSRAAERVQGAILGSIPERAANTDAELLSYPLAQSYGLLPWAIPFSCAAMLWLKPSWPSKECKMKSKNLSRWPMTWGFIRRDRGPGSSTLPSTFEPHTGCAARSGSW